MNASGILPGQVTISGSRDSKSHLKLPGVPCTVHVYHEVHRVLLKRWIPYRAPVLLLKCTSNFKFDERRLFISSPLSVWS